MKSKLLNILRYLFPGLYLKLKYFILKNKKSDINEHLPTLSTFSSECETIFETGVRGVVSSWALLYGLSKNNFNQKRLFLNDVDSVNTESIGFVARKLGIQFDFIQKNNLQLETDNNFKFDLTFIDTLHVYGQLKRELKKFAPVTKKYIILHDTTVDADKGEVIRLNFNPDEIYEKTNIPMDELLKGLWPAVEEFVFKNKNWEIYKRYTNNNGLTILRRTEEN